MLNIEKQCISNVGHVPALPADIRLMAYVLDQAHRIAKKCYSNINMIIKMHVSNSTG